MAPPLPTVPAERLRTLFPIALGEYLDERVPDPEHKVATIAFCALLRHRHHAGRAGARRGGTGAARHPARVRGGSRRRGRARCSPPTSTATAASCSWARASPSPARTTRDACCARCARWLDVGTPLPVQIGVNRGHVFAAEVGADERAAYSAMGDTTNTAARIMSKAPVGGDVRAPHRAGAVAHPVRHRTGGPVPHEGQGRSRSSCTTSARRWARVRRRLSQRARAHRS